MIKRLVNPIRNYFRKTRHYSRLRFIVELALVPFLINLLPMLVWRLLGQEIQSTTNRDFLYLFTLGCIVAPAVETLVFQWLPIGLASFFTKRSFILLLISSVFFAVLHQHRGLSGIFMALPTGIFFAWSCLVKWEKSKWEAYWVTTAIHGLHNLVVLLFNYSLKGIFLG